MSMRAITSEKATMSGATTKPWASPQDLANFFQALTPELGIVQPCIICDGTGELFGVQCKRCGGEARLIEKRPDKGFIGFYQKQTEKPLAPSKE